MPQLKRKLPDEEVIVRISACPKCEGIVRVAVEHMMDVDNNVEFYKEAKKYDLKVSSMPLLEYRFNELAWCKCPNK